MKYVPRGTPILSACGLNCGLCPRHRTDGVSRCPGCGGENFAAKHPPCGVLSCCARHGIEYCFQCGEYPCKRYEGATLFDSFITHRHMQKDFEKVKSVGLEAYLVELQQKMELLQFLLDSCNDGRRKSFFCLAVNLLELQDVQDAAAQLQTVEDSVKERAAAAVRLLEAAAEKRGVELKLRKKV